VLFPYCREPPYIEFNFLNANLLVPARRRFIFLAAAGGCINRPNGDAMKTLITALAFSAAATAPLTARASPHKHVHAGDHKIITRPHVCWQGADLGTDPDQRIRFQIRRDADMSSSNHQAAPRERRSAMLERWRFAPSGAAAHAGAAVRRCATGFSRIPGVTDCCACRYIARTYSHEWIRTGHGEVASHRG
jgi:hypothetical protein